MRRESFCPFLYLTDPGCRAEGLSFSSFSFCPSSSMFQYSPFCMYFEAENQKEKYIPSATLTITSGSCLTAWKSRDRSHDIENGGNREW